MNFDQVLMRCLGMLNRCVHFGRTGLTFSGIFACSGVRPPLRVLHFTQASTQFSQDEPPPCERGSTWSIVSSELDGLQPQY